MTAPHAGFKAFGFFLTDRSKKVSIKIIMARSRQFDTEEISDKATTFSGKSGFHNTFMRIKFWDRQNTFLTGCPFFKALRTDRTRSEFSEHLRVVSRLIFQAIRSAFWHTPMPTATDSPAGRFRRLSGQISMGPHTRLRTWFERVWCDPHERGAGSMKFANPWESPMKYRRSLDVF